MIAFVSKQEYRILAGELLTLAFPTEIDGKGERTVRTYTLKEVSKMINISTSNIKQWEKDLSGLLTIPRSKQGARIYSEHEINQLRKIKNWEANHLGKAKIRELFNYGPQNAPLVTDSDSFDRTLPAPSEENGLSEVPTELSQSNQDQFFLAMDQYKKTFLNEVKNEIRSVVRAEVVEEVKKEISKGNLQIVKSLSDSLYKASANMQDEMKELAFTVQKASDLTDKTFFRLEKTITDQSIETSEEFFSLSKQLVETSEELSHYIEVTNNEICTLTETLEKEREYYIEGQEKLRHEVRQREIVFQDMLSNFREAASEKEKKWWRFW